MTSKLLFGVVSFAMLASAAWAQPEVLETSSVETKVVPAAPIQKTPTFSVEAYNRDVACQSAYVEEAIAHCSSVGLSEAASKN